MGASRYSEFFEGLTGFPPYPYQDRLAGDDQGRPCESRLIDVPTGMGKTAAVVLAWLWNRVVLGREDWPRRLVYCLPMRTLVEQTRDSVNDWLKAALEFEKHKPSSEREDKRLERLKWLADNSPVILMGGEEPDPEQAKWDLYPEREAIVIGTQDMLLSRALNRGYGMSRYRWSMHFGLLNNDCLWVMDEVQLMGAGVATGSQLHAFRTKLETLGPSQCWWMSATIHGDWLRTVDFNSDELPATFQLDRGEVAQNPRIRERVEAIKPITKLPTESSDTKALGQAVVSASESADGLTLIVVNTVKRAVDLHQAIRKALSEKAADPLLLHSHFREPERQAILEKLLLLEGGPGIAVCTQVVEAGVDLSASLLVTDLAPWSSLVQRFGRCNRRGTENTARIFWIDLDETKAAAPYTSGHLTRARERLEALDDAGPTSLGTHPLTPEDRAPPRHVLRKKDLLELFDTTPDLSGNDLDIDRFVRDADDTLVRFFWRDWEDKVPPEKLPQPLRKELCPAGITEADTFLKRLQNENKGYSAWVWDFLEKQWTRFDPYRLRPGLTLLVHAGAGGYQTQRGFDPRDNATVSPVALPELPMPPEADGDDFDSSSESWQSLGRHTDAVCAEMDRLLHALGDNGARNDEPIRTAARWHDWGKVHSAFQSRIRETAATEKQKALGDEPVAKAPESAWKNPTEKGVDILRRHFRHELASALAFLLPEVPIDLSEDDRDLAAYLIAAHHGKVRLALRSLPNEKRPPDSRRFARGVWDGDKLPTVSLGNGVDTPEAQLSLEPMELGLGEAPPFTGQPSWTERTLALLESHGPFRLAFLEALLRAADGRGSQTRPDKNRTP